MSDSLTSAESYQGRNTALFERRSNLKTAVDTLRGEAENGESRLAQRQLQRTLRELNDVTYEIVQLNFGLVRSYAKLFSAKATREDAEDFEAAATLGLMRAIESFDPSRGKFGQWAYKPIQREVLRAVREAEFKMNPGDFERRPEILRAANMLAETLGRTPTMEEVATEAHFSVEQVRRVLDAPRFESLSNPVGDDSDTQLADTIAADTTDLADQIAGTAMLASLEQFGLSALDERELLVLVRRFGLDGEPEQNLSTIGEELSLSREAVRQVESKALAKIQHPFVLRRIYRNGRA
jgi:RNA polymerase sigma factor (sigma-70 family)